MERPLLRTALLQLAHEQAVRQHDQVHVPGLALDVTQLTVTQPELLLAVPMGGLCTRPAMPVHPHDPTHPPGDPVGHQDLDRLRVLAMLPEGHDPHLVLDVGNPDRRREIPLPLVPDPQPGLARTFMTIWQTLWPCARPSDLVYRRPCREPAPVAGG